MDLYKIAKLHGIPKKDAADYEATLHRMLELLFEVGEPIEVKGVFKTKVANNEKSASNKRFVRGALKKKNRFYIYNHIKARLIK